MLIKIVAPALNIYMHRRGLKENEDPFRSLLRVVDEADINPTWMGGRNHKTVVYDSFDGQNSACHMKFGIVSGTLKMYIKSWIDLCLTMRGYYNRW